MTEICFSRVFEQSSVSASIFSLLLILQFYGCVFFSLCKLKNNLLIFRVFFSSFCSFALFSRLIIKQKRSKKDTENFHHASNSKMLRITQCLLKIGERLCCARFERCYYLPYAHINFSSLIYCNFYTFQAPQVDRYATIQLYIFCVCFVCSLIQMIEKQSI